MQYKKQIFHVENMSTERLAKKLATPLYCYSYLKLKSNHNYSTASNKKV